MAKIGKNDLFWVRVFREYKYIKHLENTSIPFTKWYFVAFISKSVQKKNDKILHWKYILINAYVQMSLSRHFWDIFPYRLHQSLIPNVLPATKHICKAAENCNCIWKNALAFPFVKIVMTPDACKTQGQSSTILTYHQKDDILMLPPSAFKCSFLLLPKLNFSMHSIDSFRT